MRAKLAAGWTASLLALAAAACGPEPPAATAKVPVVATVRPGPAPKTELPATGILEEKPGKNGAVVRVEHKDGLRVLSVDGVVRAACPIAEIDEAPTKDPFATLIAAARPAPTDGKTPVLLLGLGSVRTARQLAATGYDMEVVEDEPVVIEMARKYFGFEGKAAERGIVERLASASVQDTIVVVEHTAGIDMQRFAQHLLDSGLRRARLLAFHDVGAPFDERIHTVYGTLAAGGAVEMLGSGLADGEQDLYLFFSGKQEIELVTPALRDLGLSRIPANAEDMPAADRGGAVDVIGYLVRMPNGALAIDLPLHEAGAARYLLSGDTGALEKLLPAGTAFPTGGGLPSDGDTSKTVRDLLGGGGRYGSDVRFSPVLVHVAGAARLIAVVSPKTGASAAGGSASTGLLLPHGGALYEISMSEQPFTMSKAEWESVQKEKLEKPWKTALGAVRAGKLLQAAEALGEYESSLEGVLGGGVLLHTDRGRHVHLLHEAIGAGYEESRSSPPSARGGVVGSACHEGWQLGVFNSGAGSVQPLRDALLECADTFLTRAILSGPEDLRPDLARKMRDVLVHRYEGEKRKRKWKTLSNWVLPLDDP